MSTMIMKDILIEKFGGYFLFFLLPFSIGCAIVAEVL